MATDQDTAATTDAADADAAARTQRRRHSKRRYILRRVLVGALVVIVAFVGFFAVTFIPYVRDSQGEPTEVLLATWGRDHGLGPVVAKAEDFYYAHVNTVAVGGTPTEAATFAGEDPTTAASPSTKPSGSTKPGATPTATTTVAHLTPPQRLVSPASNPLPKEGVWQPVGTEVSGQPAIYVTRVRPDAVHTSVLASVMWIDTKLTKMFYVPGYIEPGGPSPSQGALPQQYWPQVLANFNGGFRIEDSRGGYYYNGTTVAPLVQGRASTVVYKDGHVVVGKWGRDVSMSSSVAIVRQNLDLIIDKGKSRVQDPGSFTWGATTKGETYAWRSAIGQRADGSLLYIGSPGLSAQTMADTLVQAGAVRAMVLDMNNWWVAGFYFGHNSSGAPICHKLDPNIAEGCDRFLNRYKRDSFQVLAKQS
jgi:hypothetical protein